MGQDRNPGLLSHRAGADDPAASTDEQDRKVGAPSQEQQGPKTGKPCSSSARLGPGGAGA